MAESKHDDQLAEAREESEYLMRDKEIALKD